MQLETDRLLLRDICVEDEEVIVEHFAESQSYRHILKFQRSSDYIREYVRRTVDYAKANEWDDRCHFHLAVVRKGTAEPVGTCNISDVFAGSRRALLGWHYSIAHSGRGYATEVARELIRFGFFERRAKRISAHCFESNRANVRIFCKAGMQPLSFLPVRKWFLGLRYRELRPIVGYAISA